MATSARRRASLLVLAACVLAASAVSCDGTYRIVGPETCLVRDTTAGGKSYIAPCPVDTLVVP